MYEAIHVPLPGEEELYHVRERVFRRLSEELGESVFEADSECGLHDLAHGLVGQEQPHRRQHQGSQHFHDLHQDDLIRGRIHTHESRGQKMATLSILNFSGIPFFL